MGIADIEMSGERDFPDRNHFFAVSGGGGGYSKTVILGLKPKFVLKRVKNRFPISWEGMPVVTTKI